jgi:hypothetical protein
MESKESEKMNKMIDTEATCSKDSNSEVIKLTAEQRARIENNRQKALLIKEKKRKNLSTNEYDIFLFIFLFYFFIFFFIF